MKRYGNNRRHYAQSIAEHDLQEKLERADRAMVMAALKALCGQKAVSDPNDFEKCAEELADVDAELNGLYILPNGEISDTPANAFAKIPDFMGYAVYESGRPQPIITVEGELGEYIDRIRGVVPACAEKPAVIKYIDAIQAKFYINAIMSLDLLMCELHGASERYNNAAKGTPIFGGVYRDTAESIELFVAEYGDIVGCMADNVYEKTGDENISNLFRICIPEVPEEEQEKPALPAEKPQENAD